ncbi:MAG: IclR family transcriptional regulator [Candidatus Dormibacteraeota bacterium]|nr:IclR family transcriptional regulator [Candidatus Dormibacteraeota bacterium]
MGPPSGRRRPGHGGSPRLKLLAPDEPIERPEAGGDQVSWKAGTQLLGRAFSLLIYLRDRDEPVTVGVLAEALRLPPATVYRLVQTLELAGFVDRSFRPYLSLGLRFMDFGQAKQRQVARELGPVAQPVLEALTAATGETALLVMPTGARAIRILSAEPSRELRLSYRPGQVLPLYAGASGKVLLPWLSASLLESALAQGDGQLLADGRRLTQAELRLQVARIRADGYCISHGELDADAAAVAAPVFLRGGQVFAAVSVAGPLAGFSPPRLPGLIERVRAAAVNLGSALAPLSGPGDEKL